MKLQNKKVYISNQELQELKHSIELLKSSDLESYRLGIRCIQSIIPKNSSLIFTRIPCKISGLTIEKNYIPIENWIIK